MNPELKTRNFGPHVKELTRLLPTPTTLSRTAEDVQQFRKLPRQAKPQKNAKGAKMLMAESRIEDRG
jgi:hypothetical protein